MLKKRGTTVVLLAALFALCMMSAFYFGFLSANRGIVIRTERTVKRNQEPVLSGDLDRYFEPEENATSTNPKEASKPSENKDKRMNINTASAKELDTLPGIGPATAKKIIEYRQRYGNFLALEEIKAVDGIGDGTYQKLKELISISDE
ncbi:MAG: ComEA family DNA-binding protein [Clostridiales bacterium]|nr:ComEA family DNA-binding protein [Clostridiales bacterium]